MKPKEKAKDLIRKFYSIGANECKQCAIITVDEIINQYRDGSEYWEQVKQEIKKI
jgi:hypothetical protein